MMRPSPLILALVLASSGLAIAVGAQTAPPAGAQAAPAAAEATGVAPELNTFPDAPGKDVVQMVCGACHSADYIIETPRNVKGFADVIEMMQAYGTTATDAQWAQIRDYIFGHIATIDINKATAEDLQKTFQVDAAVAKAVVDYRTANGNFKTIDDVKKVPGLDAKKIDYRKNRFQF